MSYQFQKKFQVYFFLKLWLGQSVLLRTPFSHCELIDQKNQIVGLHDWSFRVYRGIVGVSG
jgi:hypothetical protein